MIDWTLVGCGHIGQYIPSYKIENLRLFQFKIWGSQRDWVLFSFPESVLTKTRRVSYCSMTIIICQKTEMGNWKDVQCSSISLFLGTKWPTKIIYQQNHWNKVQLVLNSSSVLFSTFFFFFVCSFNLISYIYIFCMSGTKCQNTWAVKVKKSLGTDKCSS